MADDSPKPAADELGKEAKAGNLAAASTKNPANPGVDAKARGIRGGVHWEPDAPAASGSDYSTARDARKN